MACAPVPVRFVIKAYPSVESRIRDHQLQLRCEWKPDDEGFPASESNEYDGHGNHKLRLRRPQPTDTKELPWDHLAHGKLLVRRSSSDRVHSCAAEHSECSTI